MRTKFALFDFDKTLSRGDSIIPFVIYAERKGFAPRGQILRAAWAFLTQRRHPNAVSWAKGVSLSFLKGRTLQETDDFCRGFFRDVLAKRIFRDGRAEIERLKTEGYTVVVVSASAEAYMHLLPEFLPVDAVLATRCGLDADDVYTGQVGQNCKGVEKPLRIAAYLAAHHMELDYDTSCAYGDSLSDAPMLQLTAAPTLVNPAGKLAAALPEARRVRWK